MARLKVFKAQMGFYESVVAAPSQKAALDAWGTHQNLFQNGMAAVTDEAAAVKAATAKPGVALRRPAGSKSGFEEASETLPKLPPGPRRKPETKGKTGKTAEPKAPPPPPDRSDLDAAEKALETIEAEHQAKRAELDRARQALDAQALDLEREHRAKRKDAERALDAARRAYDRASAKAAKR